MSTTEAVNTVQILSDENVGSYQISAPFEAWQSAVKALRESGADGTKTANAVTSMLRSANQNAAPGDTIEIELQGGTETEATLAAVEEAFGPDVEVERGEYSRKANTSRKTGGKTSSNGSGRTSKSKKGTPRDCRCGCGEQTGGGTFRPGHDARFKGQMLRLIDEGGSEGEAALEQLKEFPNLYDYEQARDRLGSGPTKRAQKAEKLQELKDKKAAEKASSSDGADSEESEDSAEEEAGE